MRPTTTLESALECFGPLEGRRVLELGPLEGGHTSMLEAAGAQIDAIEANQRRVRALSDYQGDSRADFQNSGSATL